MINNILGIIGLSARARKISFGADSVEQDIKKKKVKMVIVAKDSSQRTKEKFTNLCENYQIPIIIDSSIEELSKTIGKNNKAVIGIKDINMVKRYQKEILWG